MTLITTSYLPMLVYQYFFLFNHHTYCKASQLVNKDFTTIHFAFNLELNDLTIINKICWGMIYLICIEYLLYKKIKTIPTIISVLLPSSLIVIVYQVIST